MKIIMNKTNEATPRSSRWFTAFAIALSLLLVLHHNTWAADPDPAAARFRGTGKADPIRIADIKKAAGPAGQSAITFDLAWDHSWRAQWEVPEQAHGGRLFAGIPDPERLWSHKWRGVRTAPKGVGP